MHASFLANTLGVCCLIVCTDDKAFYRRASGTRAVYRNKAHVPVSFAQSIPPRQRPNTLRDLVWFMLPQQFHQETGLDIDEYVEEVVPVAFCRDVVRGGKPQLFLILQAKVDSAHMISALRKARAGQREYRSTIQAFHIDDAPHKSDASPELAASRYFLRQLPDPN